jgi:hypothetical protein
MSHARGDTPEGGETLGMGRGRLQAAHPTTVLKEIQKDRLSVALQ